MKQIFIQNLPRTRHTGCIGEHKRDPVPEALTTWQMGVERQAMKTKCDEHIHYTVF